MVCPLFNGVLALLYFEKSVSHSQNMCGLWHQTFKKFMLIPKSTNTEIIEEMIWIDVDELVNLNCENSARKWYARWNRTEPEVLPRTERKNYLKGVPNEWCTILKLQCSLCQKCKKSTRNPLHMELEHGVDIPPYKDIWEWIKEFYDSETEKQKRKNQIMKVKRGVFLTKWKKELPRMIEFIQEKFNLVYKGNP